MTASPRRQADPAASATAAEALAARIRERVVSGTLPPGSHLSEVALCEEMQVSRNTLREGFRLLTRDGLLCHEPHRGVFVAVPDVAAIIDIYRVRRFVECPALAGGQAGHPAARRMREAVDLAHRCAEAEDWLGVGSADIAFHGAIVALADSPRLSALYSRISFELRLVFGLLADPRFLHSGFLDRNAGLLAQLERGEAATAAAALDRYLTEAERFIISAYLRDGEGGRRRTGRAG